MKIHYRFAYAPELVGNHYGYGLAAQRLSDLMLSQSEHDEESPVTFRFSAPGVFEGVKGKRNVLFTMYESPDIPLDAARRIQHADHIIVPSSFCAQGYRQYTNAPISVVPLGVEPVPYHTRSIDDVSDEKPFRFLWIGAFNPRKGWTFLSECWEQYFSQVPYMELYIKTTTTEEKKKQVYTIGNSLVDGRTLSWEEMIALYHSAHCFVLPNMGEGWGQTLAEGMMSGAPCITGEYGGVLQFANRRNCTFVEPTVKRIRTDLTTESASPDGKYQFAFIDPQKLGLEMARVMNDYNNAKVKAKRASKDVRKFTWQRCADAVLQILQHELRKA